MRTEIRRFSTFSMSGGDNRYNPVHTTQQVILVGVTAKSDLATIKEQGK